MQTRKRSSPDGDFSPKNTPHSTKSARTTRGTTRKAKTAEELLSNPKNQIYNAKTDLASLLTSAEARKTIEDLRPDLVESHRKLVADPGLMRRSIANFQRDGRNGFYDPEWQRQAREAYRRHKRGDFDEYLKWKLYQDWPELEEINKTREAREKVEAEAKAEAQAEADDAEARGFQPHTESEVGAEVNAGASTHAQTAEAPAPIEPLALQQVDAEAGVQPEAQPEPEATTVLQSQEQETQDQVMEEAMDQNQDPQPESLNNIHDEKHKDEKEDHDMSGNSTSNRTSDSSAAPHSSAASSTSVPENEQYQGNEGQPNHVTTLPVQGDMHSHADNEEKTIPMSENSHAETTYSTPNTESMPLPPDNQPMVF